MMLWEVTYGSARETWIGVPSVNSYPLVSLRKHPQSINGVRWEHRQKHVFLSCQGHSQREWAVALPPWEGTETNILTWKWLHWIMSPGLLPTVFWAVK